MAALTSAGCPSMTSETPIIWLALVDQTDPASVRTAGPLVLIWAVALIGSGPDWGMMTWTTAMVPLALNGEQFLTTVVAIALVRHSRRRPSEHGPADGHVNTAS